MDTPGNDMNWDKLLEALENADTTALNEEELAMLHAARDMKSRVQTAEKFPTEEGWQRFVAERDKRQLKVHWRKRLTVAAAVALLLVGASTWWITQKQHHLKTIAKADLKPQNGVQIKLSNGKVMKLDSAGTIVQSTSGALIKADSAGIVYNAGANQEAVVAKNDTLVVPKGNKIRIALADGTRVWVNAASELIYPSAFNGPTREVQVHGEAYFEVAVNVQQPFIVQAGEVSVQVLGTSFNVNTYNTNIQTTLTSGKVSATADGKKVVLSPGQQAVYHPQTGDLQQLTVETRIFTAWKDGDVYFEEENLSTIVKSLSRSYDYEFKFEDATLEKINLTLDMPGPVNLQQVLDHIRISNREVVFRIEGRTIYVTRVGQAGQ
ncbi:MAG: FecR domain-containing protein [Chitinophaga sp.]|uniref:FecR family protein n=1 Tax=Chitinophaga sp. TaxID=1869181 RepID=UPI0025BF5667|nr:FecR family protein [Chitinophaga sp.]MBV8255545.1 FecR domain-containing protein [Chitinophaga sp.]